MPSNKEKDIRKGLYFKNGCYFNHNDKVVRVDAYKMGQIKIK